MSKDLVVQDQETDEDNFDDVDDVVKSIDDLFDILDECLNAGADIFVEVIPIAPPSVEEDDNEAFDRAMDII